MARSKPLLPPDAARNIWRPRPSQQQIHKGHPTTVTIPRALAYMALVGLAVLFLWLTIRVDLLIFGGVLFAASLHRAAKALSRLIHLSTRWSLLIVVLLIVVFFAAMGWLFAQAITSQMSQLSQQLPAAAEKVGNMIGQSGIGKMLIRHLRTGNVQTSPTAILQNFFGIATNIVEIVGAIVVILFLALYLAADADRYSAGLMSLVPLARRKRASEILHETGNTLWYWTLGRLFSMSVLGVMTAIGLWVLGVPLPVALGFLAGLMIFVPYIGSIASAIPSVLIAASVSLSLAIYVVGLYVGVHLVEGYILVPLVQRRMVRLPPPVTLSAQIILGVLAGLVGVLFAEPLVAAGRVIVRMVYVEDILGDRRGSSFE